MEQKGNHLASWETLRKKIFQELVKKSEVVLHNFTPGISIAEELYYEGLNKLNPSIIVAAISGFGQNGPDSKLVCFVHIAQARSGGIILTGFPGDPPLKTTITHDDLGAGTYTALGIVTALYYRERAGKGSLSTSPYLTLLFLPLSVWEHCCCIKSMERYAGR